LTNDKRQAFYTYKPRLCGRFMRIPIPLFRIRPNATIKLQIKKEQLKQGRSSYEVDLKDLVWFNLPRTMEISMVHSLFVFDLFFISSKRAKRNFICFFGWWHVGLAAYHEDHNVYSIPGGKSQTAMRENTHWHNPHAILKFYSVLQPKKINFQTTNRNAKKDFFVQKINYSTRFWIAQRLS